MNTFFLSMHAGKSIVTVPSVINHDIDSGQERAPHQQRLEDPWVPSCHIHCSGRKIVVHRDSPELQGAQAGCTDPDQLHQACQERVPALTGTWKARGRKLHSQVLHLHACWNISVSYKHSGVIYNTFMASRIEMCTLRLGLELEHSVGSIKPR